MPMMLRRIIVLVLAVLVALPLLAANQGSYKLDGIWLGATMEDLTSAGLLGNVNKSNYLSGGMAFYVSRLSEAHFKRGTVKLIIGERLLSGDAELVNSSMTPEQVWAIAKQQGWQKLRQSTAKTDTGSSTFDIAKYKLDDDQELLFVTPAKSEAAANGKSSYMILRESAPTGPFPNL